MQRDVRHARLWWSKRTRPSETERGRAARVIGVARPMAACAANGLSVRAGPQVRYGNNRGKNSNAMGGAIAAAGQRDALVGRLNCAKSGHRKEGRGLFEKSRNKRAARPEAYQQSERNGDLELGFPYIQTALAKAQIATAGVDLDCVVEQGAHAETQRRRPWRGGCHRKVRGHYLASIRPIELVGRTDLRIGHHVGSIRQLEYPAEFCRCFDDAVVEAVFREINIHRQVQHGATEVVTVITV
jgi:hypothetical protein